MAQIEVADPGEVGMAADRLDLARQLLRDHVDSGGTPAAAAIVVRHGEVVLAEARGVQRPGGPELRLDHVWALASGCKPMTAAVVLSLVEDGLLGIMEPVVDHLPELAGSTHDEVLVHHLLTHTPGWEAPMFSGRLFEVMGSGELPEPPPGVPPFDHALRWVSLHPIRRWGVGEMMCYATVNYTLLSEIVRRVTGGSLGAALREQLFDPLGMDHTSMGYDDALRPELVRRDEGVPMADMLDGPGMATADDGGTGVHSSPWDVAAFGQMILDGGRSGGGQVLASSTIASMCTDQIPGLPAHFGTDMIVPTASWGYGFSVLCEQRWPFFGGALVPNGSVTHPGAGGVDFWIDFEHDLVGVFFEVITQLGPTLEPISGIGHRFQDVITGAVR